MSGVIKPSVVTALQSGRPERLYAALSEFRSITKDNFVDLYENAIRIISALSNLSSGISPGQRTQLSQVLLDRFSAGLSSCKPAEKASLLASIKSLHSGEEKRTESGVSDLGAQAFITGIQGLLSTSSPAARAGSPAMGSRYESELRLKSDAAMRTILDFITSAVGIFHETHKKTAGSHMIQSFLNNSSMPLQEKITAIGHVLEYRLAKKGPSTWTRDKKTKALYQALQGAIQRFEAAEALKAEALKAEALKAEALKAPAPKEATVLTGVRRPEGYSPGHSPR